MFLFCYFYIFSFKKFSLFFVLLYKELSEPTFSSFPMVLDNLSELFKCSVITDFISTMFGFSKFLVDTKLFLIVLLIFRFSSLKMIDNVV